MIDQARQLQAEDRKSEAESALRRVLALQEEALGPDHPDVARTLNDLAVVLRDQGRGGEAEPLLRRALAILEQSLGSGLYYARSPDSVDYMSRNIAHNYGHRAAAVYSRMAFADLKQFAGRGNTTQVSILVNLAIELERNGRTPEARVASARAATFLRAAYGAAGLEMAGWNLVQSAWELRQAQWIQDARLTDESFQDAQEVTEISVGAALAQMAARVAVGTDSLASMLRLREDLARQRKEIVRRLLDGNAAGEAWASLAQQVSDLLAVTDQLDRADAELAARFPAYAELTDPQPLPTGVVASLLAPDEALLSYLVRPNGGVFLWIVRPDRTEWRKLGVAPAEIAERVKRLRAALDPGTGGGVGIPFPTAEAAILRRELLPDETTLLAGARHLFVVPDGALRSLPFAVLAGRGGSPDTADWLVERYATTTLPAVSSLKALRQLERAERGNAPFAGVGDPVLAGHGVARGIAAADLYGTRGLADPARLGLLPALPSTRRELKSLASQLGGGPESLHLGPAATETAVKTGVLANARVVAFATHAAVAGDLGGLAEPALVLTPPPTATEQDDGLLTASEAAQLKLNADLVLLSACNTAAPDGTPGAVGLSGLAKAFFYAGTQTLLVSHWAIYDEATPALTTGMIEALAAGPGIGLAEALRRSQLVMIRGRHPHPSEWAPFVVVGEGGAGRGVLELGPVGG